MATKRKLSQTEAPQENPASGSASHIQPRTLLMSDGADNGSQDQAAIDKRYAELYAKAPDFQELAKRDPDFAQALNSSKLDFFNDPKRVMQLTKTLLKLDFGLKVEFPDDRLCPPVTNRHNYILWVKDLLDSTSYDDSGGKIIGLDIGTGASCIYPLLGCTQRPWSFIATDIDEESLKYAKKNVNLNNLENRINIVQRQPDDAMIPLDDLNIPSIAFTMTNPPFYKSAAEMLASAAQKSRPPFTACTGAQVEMVTPGGEVAFVDRILQESLVLKERVRWYTSMFGFLTSLIDFVEKLKKHGIDNYAMTEFVQGKTRRWAVAWSFGGMRPSTDVVRGLKSPTPNILPPSTEAVIIQLPTPSKIASFTEPFINAVSALDLTSWAWDQARLEGTGRAPDKVWGRAWRRRKMRETHGDKPTRSYDPKGVFGFRVYIRVGTEEVTVGCRWLEGHDAVAFESFQGFLKTTAKGILSQQEVITQN